jgi:hypothetical protein
MFGYVVVVLRAAAASERSWVNSMFLLQGLLHGGRFPAGAAPQQRRRSLKTTAIHVHNLLEHHAILRI